MKMRFFTKFDLPKKVLRDFDNHDNVDRLTYLDNTQQIMRFMEAGKNLKFSRSAAMYQDEKEALADNTSGVVPVYPEDPVITSVKMAALDSEIKEKVAEINALAEDPKRSEDPKTKVDSTSVVDSDQKTEA